MDICSVNILVRFSLTQQTMGYTVIGSKRSNIDGSIRARDRLQSDARRHQALVGDLQHLPLLGIEPLRLYGSDVEERWISILRPSIKEITTGNIERSRPLWALLVMGINVETGFRDLWRLARSLLDDHAPERRIRVDPAWKSTRCIDVINVSHKLKLNKASDLPIPQIATGSSAGLSCPSVVTAVGDILDGLQDIELFSLRLIGLSRFRVCGSIWC